LTEPLDPASEPPAQVPTPPAPPAVVWATPTVNPRVPTKFCHACGAEIDSRAEICPKCGVRQVAQGSGKSRPVATLLALLLGGLGIHKFYLGKTVLGIIYLIFFWTGIPALIGWIEGITYLATSDEAWAQRYGGPVQKSSGAAIGCLWIFAIGPIIAFLLLIALIFLGSQVSTVLDKSPGALATSAATHLVSSPPTATNSLPAATDNGGTASFTAITLKGNGKKVAKFAIPVDEAALAQAAYSGSGNFAVTSLAQDGSQNELLINTIGAYRGTVLFDSGAGQHSVAFSVDAEGPWTIVVKPVTSARVWNGTSVLTGTGDDVVLISPASSGLVTLDLKYKGAGNFAITSYTIDSSSLLANEIGNFTGQVALPDGTVLLSITAEGTWSATPG
jgi:TM2 domain-containing membrane protein YozV